MSTHDDLRIGLGSYALGNLDPAEHETIRVHLETCAECRAELALLQPLPDLLTLTRGAAADPVEASSLLEQRVLEDRRQTATTHGRVAPSTGRRQRLPWARRPRLAVASVGALAGVVATLGVLATTGSIGGDGAGGATTVALRSASPATTDAATARIVATATGSRVRLDASLPPTRGSEVYELWFVNPRGRVSAGTFRVGPDGRARTDLGVAAGTQGFGRIGITREPDADDPARNGTTVLSGALAG